MPSNSGLKTKTKKVLCRKILGYYIAITRFDLFLFLFCPRKKLYSLLCSTSSNSGGHSLEMPARGTGPATYFWGTILAFGAHFSLGGHISCLGGTSNDLGGTTPKCPFLAPGLHSRLSNHSKHIKHSRHDKRSRLSRYG